MNPLPCQKDLFELQSGIHYLNGAYMSPNLKAVEEAGFEGIKQKRRPTEVTPDQFFTESHELRALFTELINTTSPNDIAIIPAVSYGLATAARGIPFEAGDEIIIAGEQFPSNVYIWRRIVEEQGAVVRTIPRPKATNEVGKIWNEHILEAISSKTKVVAISNVHWTDGTRFELEKISQRIHEVDGFLVVDGTQSVGALPFDVQQVQPDALVCAGYKWLMGPYGLGLAYYSPRLQEGQPLEENWILRKDSEDFTRLINYQENYQPGAIRFDMGERSNFILVPMLKAALRQLLEWTPEAIQNYTKELMEPYLQRLIASGCWVEDAKYRSHHLFGIYVPDHLDPNKLNDELKKNDVFVSVRGQSVRVSPNVYNKSEDAEALTLIIEQQVV